MSCHDQDMAAVDLERPTGWAHARHLSHDPAEVVDIELDGQSVHAVRLGVRPTHTTQSVVMTLLGVVFAALAGGAIVLAILDPAWDSIIGSIVLVGFAALFLISGLLDVRAARRGLGIDLTPDDVTFGLGYSRTTMAWGDITEIRAFSIPHHGDWLGVATREPQPPTDSTTASRLATDLTAAVPCRKLKPDPLVVYHGLRYFLEHPEARAELRGDAGERRLNSRRLA